MSSDTKYKTQSLDTAQEAEEVLVELYRRMSPIEKMQKMAQLNEMADQLATSDIRSKYPQADERELRIRLAARKYDRQLMIDAFGWDPKVHGY